MLCGRESHAFVLAVMENNFLSKGNFGFLHLKSLLHFCNTLDIVLTTCQLQVIRVFVDCLLSVYLLQSDNSLC